MTEIVAEISGNHGGSLENAILLIELAKTSGADAVKFQCFDPERLAIKRNRPEVLPLAHGVPLIDLYRRVVTPREWFPRLIKICADLNMPWFSSVFDPLDVAFLETLDCPRYKISAFEMLDWELIKAVKETGKPIVMSVRPTPGVTVLLATDYDGSSPAFGISSHNVQFSEENGPGILPLRPDCPMVEYHLRLEGVDTPDRDFSVTPEQLREIVGWIK